MKEKLMTTLKLKMKLLFIMLLAVSSISTASMSVAQDGVKVEGDVSFVTDYNLRGLSRSDGGVALQGGIYIFSDDSNFSGGVFVSSLDKDFLGHEGEVEFYVNYDGTIGAYDYKLSAKFDTFHGQGNSTGYASFNASLARDFGRLYVNAGTSYSPSKREIGLGSSIYGYLDVDVPIPMGDGPSVWLGLHAGYENFEGPLDKWDWGLGINLALLDYEAGLKYVGSDNDAIIGSGERVLFSLKRYF